MRLGCLIRGDIHFQWKYGLYFIYFISMLLYVCAITALPEYWKRDIAAIMIYSDPAAMDLFSVEATVLLERSQKMLNTIVISSVKVSEYILSKTITLTATSAIVVLILGLVSGSKHLFDIAVGTALTSAIFTMPEIITATRVSNSNQFPTVIMSVEIVCFAPSIIGLFVKSPDIFRLSLFVACMSLITGKSSLLSFDIILVPVTLIILYMVARRTVEYMWRALGGVKL